MHKLPSKWLVASLLATALVAGCGGDSSSPSVTAPPNPSQSAQSVVDYILALMASSTTDLADPIDINSLTLATEDLADPSPI